MIRISHLSSRLSSAETSPIAPAGVTIVPDRTIRPGATLVHEAAPCTTTNTPKSPTSPSPYLSSPVSNASVTHRTVNNHPRPQVYISNPDSHQTDMAAPINPGCLAGGTWYACDAASDPSAQFIGCCRIDACAFSGLSGCPTSELAPASFNPASEGS